MRFFEFTTPKQPTPEQGRINSIKQQKERANRALKAEKTRQKIEQGQQALAKK